MGDIFKHNTHYMRNNLQHIYMESHTIQSKQYLDHYRINMYIYFQTHMNLFHKFIMKNL